MFFKEAKKVFALYEVDLARIQGFSGELVGFAGYGGAEPQHLARLRNFQDQRLAIGRADGQLDASFAEHVNAAWSLSFDEQNSALGVGGCVFNCLKGLQSGIGQITEEAVCAQLTSKAALDNVQTVW